MPERIQQRRTKGWRMPENARGVARPSKWGNPYRVGDVVLVEGPWRGQNVTIEYDVTPALAVELYRQRFIHDAAEIREELAGLDLACFCAPGQPCHADVLLEIANATPPSTSTDRSTE
jgi:hypothetical protein